MASAKKTHNRLPKLIIAKNLTPRPNTSLAFRTHSLQADIDQSQGGDDSGADPIDLLLSALASATAIEIRSLAVKRGWALDEVKVEVLYDRVQGKNCAFKKVILRGMFDEIALGQLAKLAQAPSLQSFFSADQLHIFTEVVYEK